MKKRRIILSITLTICSLIWIRCQKDHFTTESVKDKLSIETTKSLPDPNAIYFNSVAFQAQITNLGGLEQIKNNGLNLEILDFNQIVQTDPVDPLDFPFNPMDVGIKENNAIIIKIVVTKAQGPWGGLSPGVYLLDLDRGKVFNIIGNCVLGC